jgi:kynurenine 3-monooxygenase
VVPFYGQGANAAFEDCTVLNQCLRESAPDVGRAFARFYGMRKPNADALADLAVENFIEMRDKTGSKVFLMKKKGEKLLHRTFPKWYLPLYTMVSFTRIPYVEAVHRARQQNRVVLDMVISCVISLIALVVIWWYWRY